MIEKCAVTGAFGFSGKYITARLLENGHEVITLTNSMYRPFGNRIKAYPLDFRTEKMVEALNGVNVLYNTYWVRFNHPLFTFASAVNNTVNLFAAAKAAGVQRIVHVSITNPSVNSHLEYFSGKAKIENVLKSSGISYAILRPAVLFGKEDILINNIAWTLRRFPIFTLFGDGRYLIQPIYVDDFAKLAVEHGPRQDNVTIDAIGPETYTYRNLVKTIGESIGKRRTIISVPPLVGYRAGWLIGKFVNDIMITKEEVKGLMQNLLYVESPPTGSTRLSDWAKMNSETLGVSYASELTRRIRKEKLEEVQNASS